MTPILSKLQTTGVEEIGRESCRRRVALEEEAWRDANRENAGEMSMIDVVRCAVLCTKEANRVICFAVIN